MSWCCPRGNGCYSIAMGPNEFLWNYIVRYSSQVTEERALFKFNIHAIAKAWIAFAN